MLKTYQFKTHCEGDSHSSKTSNIILPGLVIKQRWMTLRLQAVVPVGYSTWVRWVVSTNVMHSLMNLSTISLADARSFTFVLSRVLAKWYLQF